MKLQQLLATVLVLISFSTIAQTVKNSVLYNLVAEKRQFSKTVSRPVLFKQSAAPVQNEIAQIVKKSTRLELDKTATLHLYAEKPSQLALAVPYDAAQTFTLQLDQQPVNSFDDFAFGSIEGGGYRKKSTLTQGLHYRGYIDGDPTSIAAISVFDDGTVMGLFSGRQGNFVIGKSKVLDGYMVYNSDDMLVSPQFECATKDVPLALNPSPTPPSQNAPATLCKKVRFYWEGDYELYSLDFNSNLTDTRNYLTGLFNQVATIYQNEGIEVELSEAYVWTADDPYANGTSTLGLDGLKNRWNALGNKFNGDIAHLVSGGTTNNGGLAYILSNAFCNRAYAYGYSNVYATYKEVPTYSWDVMVLCHEIGHNMGSNHTHWCGWNTGANGTCGAIDNCYPVETSSGCTTCLPTTDTANLPAGFKGTIMSYCYLKNNIGVNFSLGFGPLPQAAIRANLQAAACPVLSNHWSGAVSTAWENTANWSCGALPNANTDVTIATGLPNYPVVNSAAVCRRLKQAPGTSVTINAGKTLNVAGK